MSPGLSPFIEKPVACPACQEEHAQRHFRQRMYVAGDRESDGHVTVYTWLADRAEPVHPPYYFLHFCPHCHFTDQVDHFVAPEKSPVARPALRAFQEASEEERAMIDFLAAHTGYDTIAFESALHLHFLALYIQLMLPQGSEDAQKIARLFLRIAWLYREQAPAAAEGEPGEEDELLAQAGAFEAALAGAREAWGGFVQVLGLRRDELDGKLASPAANPYRKHRANVDKLLAALSSEAQRMKEVCRQDLEGTLLDKGGLSGKAFFGYASHAAFLADLKGRWPGAPMDEREAIENAIAWLKKAVAHDPAFDEPRKYIGAIRLMADLMIRCGDLDGAYEMVRGIYKSATDGRNRFQQELKQGKIDEGRKSRVLGQIRRMNDSIQQAGEVRDGLIDRLIERDQERIDAIIAAEHEESLEFIEHALESAGIVQGVIQRLKGPGGPLEEKAAKKGGLFRKR